METNENEIIRKRYPHAPPNRIEFGTPEAYEEAHMRFLEGQAALAPELFSVMPFPSIVTLFDGTIIYANSEAQQLLGITPSDETRRRANDFLFDADGNLIGEAIGARIERGERIRQEAVYVLRPDGRHDLRMLTVSPVYAPGTRTIIRVEGFFHDPTSCERELESLRSLNEQLTKAIGVQKDDVERYKRLAYTDDMTGVGNKRAFWEGFRDAVGEARRERGSVALFYFDPDEFKRWNDEYGHRAGDNLVRAVAGRLRSIADPYDGTVARLGGDEFCVYFRGVNAAKYEEIAKAFAEVMTFDFETLIKGTREKTTLLVTVSIGGSLQVDGIIPEPGDVLAEADEAMYECKQHGKGAAKTLPYVLRFPHIHSSKPPQP